MHLRLWIVDAPILTEGTTAEYIAFVYSIVKATVRDRAIEKEQFDFVITYQIHSHSKLRSKFKNQVSQYQFGNFFTDHIIIAKALPKEITEEQIQAILQKREVILSTVKEYIDTYLNSKKRYLFYPSKENFEIAHWGHVQGMLQPYNSIRLFCSAGK